MQIWSNYETHIFKNVDVLAPRNPRGSAIDYSSPSLYTSFNTAEAKTRGALRDC